MPPLSPGVNNADAGHLDIYGIMNPYIYLFNVLNGLDTFGHHTIVYLYEFCCVSVAAAHYGGHCRGRRPWAATQFFAKTAGMHLVGKEGLETRRQLNENTNKRQRKREGYKKVPLGPCRLRLWLLRWQYQCWRLPVC
jgi:hypothetical protein